MASGITSSLCSQNSLTLNGGIKFLFSSKIKECLIILEYDCGIMGKYCVELHHPFQCFSKLEIVSRIWLEWFYLLMVLPGADCPWMPFLSARQKLDK